MDANSQQTLDTTSRTVTSRSPVDPTPKPRSSQRQTVHDLITSRMVELLERGTVPWRSGWTRSPVGAPRSARTGKVYRGINHFLLAVAAQAAGYARSSWITFRQAKELGGSVRKGEKGLPCIFWRVLDGGTDADERDTDAADDGAARSSGRRRFVVRYYTVFNVQQCDAPVRRTWSTAARGARSQGRHPDCRVDRLRVPVRQPTESEHRVQPRLLLARQRPRLDAFGGGLRHDRGLLLDALSRADSFHRAPRSAVAVPRVRRRPSLRLPRLLARGARG